MTYNVNHGLAGDEAGLDAILEGDADLVFLQETNAEWERAIRRKFSSLFPHMTFDECCLSGGTAILSRFPIKNVETIDPPNGGWFPAQRADIVMPHGTIEVLNVHLRPQRADTGGVAVGMWTTPPIRRRQIRRYLDHLESDRPTLVVGDFNEETRSNVIAELRDRGLHCALCRDRPHTPTWRWNTSVGTVRRQFDHVTYDPETFALESTRIIAAGNSDHLPVLVELADRRASSDR
jgi:endonuclease/exonuclease/phosphatase family metal-dependent hydrolase